ncbi:MAG: hypothetical protein ABW094_01800 [Candidatus Thiodiazotropha sp.]|uniref:Uncharacterized protein n=1 Tax=Candidatus Thiodiazotropha taylori TaxID=2792791 RepID=A0A9E4NLZ2_9GAMM|nr:hypothetical protein [Candidatus Thiodiazotropha taylori]MCW4237706.1 hypothetical protein [Candidatus Thiodiazotropha endolucinida]
MHGYKPGLLINLFGITREQLRYWRRELDPVPSRPLFSYQMLLGYAVLTELIVERWMEPRRLKAVNLQNFFAWFERQHSYSEVQRTVILIDRHSATLDFCSLEDLNRSKLANDGRLETVYLKTVEEQLLNRFRKYGG